MEVCEEGVDFDKVGTFVEPQQSHWVLITTGAGFWAQHAHTDCPQHSHCFCMASFIVTTVIPDVLTGTVFPLSHGHAPLHVPHGGGAIDAFKFSTIFGR